MTLAMPAEPTSPLEPAVLDPSTEIFIHYCWASHQAMILADSAYISEWQIREFKRDVQNNYNENSKLTVNDVRGFLIYKGTNTCIREHMEESWESPVSLNVANRSRSPPMLRRQFKYNSRVRVDVDFVNNV